MRLSIAVFWLLCWADYSYGQTPVKIRYDVKQKDVRTFIFIAHLDIEKGWHVSSKDQPRNSVVLPTGFFFSKNPLLQMVGKHKEIGKLIKEKNEKLEIESWYYQDSLELQQEIKAVKSVKTNLNGTIKFQACTNEKCLVPETIKFSVSVGK